MRARSVSSSEIAKHGGILSAEHYIPSPEPVRERLAVLNERRDRLTREIAATEEQLLRLERGEACNDPRHK